MTDETIAQSKAPGAQFITSPQYRIIHSNLFRYRINLGAAMFHFQTVTDTGNGAVIAIDEVSIGMSFTQLKALKETLNNLLDVIEKEIGPIEMPVVTAEDRRAFREQTAKLVRSVYNRA